MEHAKKIGGTVLVIVITLFVISKFAPASVKAQVGIA